MTDKDFMGLWKAAWEYDDREAYIAQFDKDLTKEYRSATKRSEYLGRIWDIAHLSIRDMIAQAGFNQTSFSYRFCIPLRTVQNWCNDVNPCPPYVKLGFARQLDMI